MQEVWEFKTRRHIKPSYDQAKALKTQHTSQESSTFQCWLISSNLNVELPPMTPSRTAPHLHQDNYCKQQLSMTLNH